MLLVQLHLKFATQKNPLAPMLLSSVKDYTTVFLPALEEQDVILLRRSTVQT